MKNSFVLTTQIWRLQLEVNGDINAEMGEFWKKRSEQSSRESKVAPMKNPRMCEFMMHHLII